MSSSTRPPLAQGPAVGRLQVPSGDRPRGPLWARLWLVGLLVPVLGCLTTPDPALGQQVLQGKSWVDTKTGQLVSSNPTSSPYARRLWEEHFRQSIPPNVKKKRAVFHLYTEILGQWAESPGREQVELLAELEYRLSARQRCIGVVEGEVLRQIGKTQPEALVPILLLQMLTWEHHLQSGRFSMIEDAYSRTQRWLRFYVELDPEPSGSPGDPKQLAADLLTLYAELIWGSGYFDLLPQASASLDRALEFTPRHFLARHLRALVYEKQERYRRAQEDLQILATRQPAKGDVYLRLGVQQQRLGEMPAAEASFKKALSVASPAWVKIVARQQLAPLLSDMGRTSEARSLLMEGHTSYPENPRFPILLADLDRRPTKLEPAESAPTESAPTEAGQIGSSPRQWLDRWQVDSGPTPRLTYLQAPHQEVLDNRQRVEDSILPRAVLLLEVIQALDISSLDPTQSCSSLWRHLLPEDDGRGNRGVVRPQQPRVTPSLAAPAPTTKAPQTTTRPPAPPVVPKLPSATPIPVGATHLSASTPGHVGSVYRDPVTGREIRIDEVVDLDLQQVYITAKRARQRFLSLSRDEITVFDEGRPQEIVTFEQGDIPFTATVLLDASGSMDGDRLESALEGARAFFAGLGDFDRARLLVAADRPRDVTTFLTADHRETLTLGSRLDRTTASGGTALFDHLYLALHALRPEQGRKVVIVLSDGYDLMSVLEMETVRDAVRRGQTQVYWVRPEPPQYRGREHIPPTSWRPVAETTRQLALLRRTVEESGGRVLEIALDDDVGEAFVEILRELREQIAVGYYAEPRHGDGRWRKIEIKSSRSGIRLRHVNGYFDD